MIQKTKKGSSSLEPAQIRLQKAREKFGSLISPERLEEFKTRVNNSGLCEIISDTVWGEDTLKYFLSISGNATEAIEAVTLYNLVESAIALKEK